MYVHAHKNKSFVVSSFLQIFKNPIGVLLISPVHGAKITEYRDGIF